jgi:hypothetical protein
MASWMGRPNHICETMSMFGIVYFLHVCLSSSISTLGYRFLFVILLLGSTCVLLSVWLGGVVLTTTSYFFWDLSVIALGWR